jgi:drug/metabolite transporter (DMT)-like permease
MSTCFVIANKWTTAANAIAIQYTSPLWIFAAGLAFGRLVLTWRRAAPMVVIAGGIALFLMEPATGPSSLAGNMVALVSGVGFALVTIFFRRLRALHGPSLVCLCNLATGLGAAPLVHDWGALGGLPAPGWAALVFLGAVQIGCAYILYAAGLQRVRPLRAATVSLIEPILNPVLVFLLLAEVPSNFGIAGAAAILVGIVMDLRLNAGEDLRGYH